MRDGADDACRFAGRMDEVVDQHVDRIDGIAPEPGDIAERSALAELAFLADDSRQTRELLRHPLVSFDHFVEDVGHATRDAGPVQRQADGEVAALQPIESAENDGHFADGSNGALDFRHGASPIADLAIRHVKRRLRACVDGAQNIAELEEFQCGRRQFAFSNACKTYNAREMVARALGRQMRRAARASPENDNSYRQSTTPRAREPVGALDVRMDFGVGRLPVPSMRIHIPPLLPPYIVLALVITLCRGVAVARTGAPRRDHAADGCRRAERRDRQGPRDLLAAVNDIETSGRGYALTADESYLEPFERARRRVPALLSGFATRCATTRWSSHSSRISCR